MKVDRLILVILLTALVFSFASCDKASKSSQGFTADDFNVIQDETGRTVLQLKTPPLKEVVETQTNKLNKIYQDKHITVVEYATLGEMITVLYNKDKFRHNFNIDDYIYYLPVITHIPDCVKNESNSIKNASATTNYLAVNTIIGLFYDGTLNKEQVDEVMGMWYLTYDSCLHIDNPTDIQRYIDIVKGKKIK